ncbi:uncharacterized protein [Onthophagus taurus]|uniref:uncharacterized protein n=1 Tax=Onthophagus taurus TaxID=166361 RepID=UPI0039BDFF1C
MNLFFAATQLCAPISGSTNQVLKSFDYLYGYDVIGVFLVKILRVKKPLISLADRTYFVLTIEAFTLIPFVDLVPTWSFLSGYKKIHCLILLKYLMRVIRSLYFLRVYYSLLITKSIVICIVLVMGIFAFSLSLIAFHCNFESTHDEICNNPFKIVVMGISAIGLIPSLNDDTSSVTWNFAGSIFVVTSFVVLITPCIVQVIYTVISSGILKFSYIFLYRSFHRVQELYGVPVLLQNQTTKYFNKMWKFCGGYSQDTSFFIKACHPALRKEILFDVSLPAFQHSKLFHDFDMYVMLQLSDLIKQRYLVSGEFVYKKGEIKNKMVYVVSGVINLLSEIDGESPIISLTHGTCIGEFSLIVPYRSNNSVQCKTFCELLIIEKKDFVKLMRKLRGVAIILKSRIKERLIEAKILKNRSDVASKNSEKLQNQNKYTIQWIKFTLHKIMSINEDARRRHELQNIYLLHQTDESVFNSMIFTANYLDMLCIAERYDEERNTIFVKTTFPYVFQPDAVIIILYKYLVAATAIYACLLIPYMAFIEVDPKNFFSIYIVTLIYIGHIYLKLSTAVINRTGVTTKMRKIFLYRLKEVEFWTDMGASIPLETFTSIILTDLNAQTSAMLRLNRLLKMYTLTTMLNDYEKQFNANVAVISLIRYTILQVYIIYFVYCVLIYMVKDTKSNTLLYWTTLMSVLGLPIEGYHLQSHHEIFFVILNALFQIFQMIKTILVISSILISQSNRVYSQQYCNDVITKLDLMRTPKIYKLRTSEYLKLQCEENLGVNLRSNLFYLSKVTQQLHNATINAITSSIWKHFEFFNEFLGEITDEMYSIMSVETLPPNEIIVYSGDYFKKCYIKYFGIIEIIDEFGNVLGQEDETEHRVINLVPGLLNTPTLFTMRTITVNRFVVFNLEDLRLSMLKHPELNEILNKTISKCSDISQELIKLHKNSVIPPKELPKKKQFHSFGYNFVHGSREEYDYYVPFDRLYPFSTLRVLFLRVTIYPDSKFLMIWEIFRCFFAIFSAILYMIPPIHLTPFKFVLILLDITAYVDIYVRMHVCFYNPDGILVTHPLITAKHYFSHGFLMDLLGVLPLNFASMPYDNVSYFMMYGNRLLQIHRYLSFMYLKQVDSLTGVPPIYIISYLPILLVIGNFFGSLIIHTECDFAVSSSNLPKNISSTCIDQSFVTNYLVTPLTPTLAQAIGFYIGISFITSTNWQNFVVIHKNTQILVQISGLIGQTLLIIATGYVMTHFMHRHGLLIEYQHAMKQLLAFMKLLNIPKNLQKLAITCCENKFELSQGKPLQYVINKLHHPIQIDILFDHYGKLAYQTSPFKSKSISFYKNIISISNYDVVVKDGYALTINDVTTTIDVIIRGNVDVIAPDGTVLTTLSSGSIIGNLKNTEMSRAKVSVLANCHVELISVKSRQFHSILSKFPTTKTEFDTLTLKHTFYIPGLLKILAPGELDEDEIKKNIPCVKTYNPDSFLIRFWLTCQLLLPCYFGILLDFFQMSTGNHSYWIISCQYFCDVLFAVHFILRNRIAYINDNGVLVRDPKKIKARNYENKFKYWLTFCSIIPFDLLIFLLPIEAEVIKTVYSIFRMNRMLRLSYIVEFFDIMNRKLKINLYVIRFAFIFVWTSLVLCGMAAILGVLACCLTINMIPHVYSCSKLHSMDGYQMGVLHSRLLSIVTYSLTLTAQYSYSPQHPLIMIIFAIMMLINHSLKAIIFGQVFCSIAEVNQIHLTFKMIRRRLEFYCVSQDLDAAVMWRMSTYTDLLWYLYKGVQYPSLLETMNPYIKDVVLASCCNKFFMNHPIFKDCHQDFLRQMISKVTFRMSFDNGYLQFRDNVEDSLFCILQGKVEVISDIFRNQVVATLEVGESFGIVQGVYENTTYKYSYRCVETTIVIVLKYQDWRHLLTFFPASKELIYERAKNYRGY